MNVCDLHKMKKRANSNQIDTKAKKVICNNCNRYNNEKNNQQNIPECKASFFTLLISMSYTCL